MRAQNNQALMRSLVLGTATAILIALSAGVKAADLSYPAAPPQYGELAPPAVVPPRLVVVPAPAAVPPYYGAPLPPLVVGPSYGVVPPGQVGVVPRGPCPQIGPCGVCGSQQAECAHHPDRYPGSYESIGRPVHPDPNTRSGAPYYGPYSQGAYSGPNVSYDGVPYDAELRRYRP